MGVTRTCPNCKKNVNSDEYPDQASIVCPDCQVRYNGLTGEIIVEKPKK